MHPEKNENASLHSLHSVVKLMKRYYFYAQFFFRHLSIKQEGISIGEV